jgi:hypothetical protein
VDQAAEGLDISIDTTGTGTLNGSITLKGYSGEAVIAVEIDLVSPPVPRPRGERRSSSRFTKPR